jgi:hypothetical protein
MRGGRGTRSSSDRLHCSPWSCRRRSTAGHRVDGIASPSELGIGREALPESQALPSAGGFAEYFLSGTRQRKLYRVPHLVNLGSRQRDPLSSVEHSAQHALGKYKFAEGQTLGKGGSRQSAVSGRPKADGRQSLPRANGWHSAKRLICRVSHSRHSAKHTLSSVIYSFNVVLLGFYT